MEGFAIYFNFTFALLGKHADCGTQIRSPERTTLEDTDEKASCELGAEWLELRTSVGCRSSEEWGNCQRCHPCCSGRNGFGGIFEAGDSFSISFTCNSDEDFFTGCQNSSQLYPQWSSKITPFPPPFSVLLELNTGPVFSPSQHFLFFLTSRSFFKYMWTFNLGFSTFLMATGARCMAELWIGAGELPEQMPYHPRLGWLVH